MEELFSIIMPAFNAEKTLAISIESVLSQSESRWRLYVVNDCSNDLTKKIILSYQDPRIVYIENRFNIGVSESRNKALSVCRGCYVSFLDSDDLWFPDKLESQLKYFEEGWDVVCSNYLTFKDDALVMTNSRVSPEVVRYSDMLKSNFIGNLTGAYNVKKIGIVNQKNIGHEDYVMWLEIIKKSKVAYCIQRNLAAYRISNSSVSSNKIKMLVWQWNIYRFQLKLPVFESLFYMVNYIYFALVKRI